MGLTDGFQLGTEVALGLVDVLGTGVKQLWQSVMWDVWSQPAHRLRLWDSAEAGLPLKRVCARVGVGHMPDLPLSTEERVPELTPPK